MKLSELLDYVTTGCRKYNITSYDAIANYLIANAEFTGWTISPSTLNDYVTAIRNDVVYWNSHILKG